MRYKWAEKKSYVQVSELPLVLEELSQAGSRKSGEISAFSVERRLADTLLNMVMTGEIELKMAKRPCIHLGMSRKPNRKLSSFRIGVH